MQKNVLPRRAVEQTAEDHFDGGEVRVIIEMFLLDVEQDRVLRLEQRDGAVALVPFSDEILAVGVPMRVCPEDRDFRTDVVTRPQSRRPQDMSRHRAGGRLAMHPRDDDAAPFLHQRGEGFRPADEKFFPDVSPRQKPDFLP